MKNLDIKYKNRGSEYHSLKMGKKRGQFARPRLSRMEREAKRKIHIQTEEVEILNTIDDGYDCICFCKDVDIEGKTFKKGVPINVIEPIGTSMTTGGFENIGWFLDISYGYCGYERYEIYYKDRGTVWDYAFETIIKTSVQGKPRPNGKPRKTRPEWKDVYGMRVN